MHKLLVLDGVESVEGLYVALKVDLRSLYALKPGIPAHVSPLIGPIGYLLLG